MPERIPASVFCDRPAPELARALIGAVFVSTVGGQCVAGRIVEAEAYLRAGDAAAHAARGRTAATEAAFGPPGTLYVHAMRGRFGFDIVAGDGSVLIRALEPLEGIATMAERRRLADHRLLLAGPARAGEALGIGRALGGADLDAADAPVWLESDGWRGEIGQSERIGIGQARHLPYRLFAAGSRFLSR